MTKAPIYDPLLVGLPAAQDAEKFLLGSVLIKGEQMNTCRDLLTATDFSIESHRRIWSKLCAMHDEGQHIDHSTVGFKLHDSGELESVGGVTYLVSLDDGLPVVSNLESYVTEIRRKSVKRRALLKCNELMIRLSSANEDEADIFADAEAAMSKLGGELIDASGFQTPGEIIRAAGGTDKYLQRRREAGISTPFPTLTNMTGGFRPGDLIVLAALTGAGKTAMAINFATHAAARGHAGAIFSLEMDAEQISDRIICARSGISSQLLRSAETSLLVDSDRRAAVSRAMAAAGELPIYISDRDRSTVPSMLAELRRLMTRQRLEFVIVDYIQLASGVGRFDRRADEVASITRGLKRMAGELRVPVIALSQFSRESAKSAREPELHDLRESGSIEQDATLVLMIHFTRMYDVNIGIDEGEAKLLVKKQRNGPTGWIPLRFHAPSGRFYEQEGRSE
jgi:replicative DNA helicase